MTVLFDESFNGTVGQNLTTNPAYAKHAMFGTGNLIYRSGGGIEHSGDTAVYYRSDVTVTNFEQEITAVLTGAHTQANGYLGLFSRTNTTDDRWIASLVQGYFGVPILSALFSTEALGSDSGGYLFNDMQNESLPAGTYRFKMSSNNYLHRLFVNGQEYIRCRDNPVDGLLTGRAGIGLGGAWTTGAGGYITRHWAATGFGVNQLQIAGDSLSQGDWYNDSSVLATIGRNNVWGAQVFQRLQAAGYTGDFGNCAVSGRRLTEELADYNTLKATTAIPPGINKIGTNYGWGIGQCRRPNAAKDVVCVMLGTNDAANGRTAAQIKADLDTYVAALKGLGFTVVLGTMIYCDEASAYIPAGFNAVVDNVNAHILAGNPGQDHTVDHSQDERVMDWSTDHRSIDGIHWRPATHAFVADLWEPKIKLAMGMAGRRKPIGLGFGSFLGA